MKIKRYINSPQGTKLLNVYIQFSKGEILVGKLILEDRLIHFKYDDDFLNLQLNLSPFRLKFNNSIQVADPVPFHGIFGLFDDSLPDG
jgi:serine/threonine-protein kinase HipA